MQNRPAFDIVVLSLVLVVHLLARENEALLHRGNAFLFLHSLLDPLNRIARVDVDFDLFSRQRPNLDHYTTQ